MRYRIHQDSVIGDRIIEAGNEIDVMPLALAGATITKTLPGGSKLLVKLDHNLEHTPGPHWEALDEAAKAWSLKCGHTFTGEMPDVLSGLEGTLADVQSRMNPQSMADMTTMMAAAMAEAFKAAGIGHQPALPARK